MSKKRSVKSKSLNRWVLPFIIVFVTVAVIGGAWYAYKLKQNKAIPFNSNVGQLKNGLPSVPGGAGNPSYNNKLYQHEREQSERAEQTGKSRISTVIGKNEAEELIEESLKPEKEVVPVKKKEKPYIPPVAKPAPQPNNRQNKQAEKDYLNRLNKLRTSLNKAVQEQMLSINKELKETRPEQKVTVFDDIDINELKTALNPPASVSNEKSKKKIKYTPFEVGEVVYGVNEIAVNSDVDGPVKVTLLSGPFKGGVFIGHFKRADTFLRLEFDIFSHNRKTYQIKGYGVDPSTQGVAVRSDVDHHRLSRWGGLIAASFLEGFADAVEHSGVTTYDGVWGTAKTYPEYNVEDQMWIAGGKVGEKLAIPMYQNFYRPPTVTLNTGEGIGVLIIDN